MNSNYFLNLKNVKINFSNAKKIIIHNNNNCNTENILVNKQRILKASSVKDSLILTFNRKEAKFLRNYSKPQSNFKNESINFKKDSFFKNSSQIYTQHNNSLRKLSRSPFFTTKKLNYEEENKADKKLIRTNSKRMDIVVNAFKKCICCF